ncbi:MAG: hypothetical protein AAGB24_10090 [Bacteroidota bacterium]
MTENEDYFRISKDGHIHTLSDRIPFKWKELIVWNSASFIILILFVQWLTAIFIVILTTIGYILYRFASWIYYSELRIDQESGKLTRVKKILERTQETELITENFDPKRIEYLELTRSGKTKFLLNYKTHKNNELLILRTEEDKKQVEKYFAEMMK